MSILDHFDRSAEHGFTWQIDPDTARRQFNLSIMLVAFIALATFTATLAMKFEAPTQGSGGGRALVQAPSLVHVQQAAHDLSQRPGG